MFPMNVRLLLKVVIPQPNSSNLLNDSFVSHELAVSCQSNVGVIYSKCNANVVMEGTVN